LILDIGHRASIQKRNRVSDKMKPREGKA
jgi:hypothetical protein